ncbi:hypothetical protein [Oceanicoccus sp. KOV_DT_Chl]|uniref:hypothetical protein n=1 Tax=Oceanicoccus sp. KOV_DT_Chl TaxID=1904639 RepID=UPI000C7E7A4C|nr:hypothetical protein [Oceanicoccus sp. KOV_DT_Chl]
MGPTPFRLNKDVIRIYISCLDELGRGRPTYIDVSAADPTKVIAECGFPVLDIGDVGTFDDNGLMATSIVEVSPDVVYMYYAGFELCEKVRYRIFTGLAISNDGGETFERHSKVPILDRADGEMYFRCGPFVLKEGGVFKLWYIAGDSWTEIDGKRVPVYDLRYQESVDGIDWMPSGKLSMALTDDMEHGFGRPWIVRRGLGYQMYYSIRSRVRGAYCLGYAESDNGIEWTRKDHLMGLDVSNDCVATEAIMYSSVISIDDRTYCFYNGNNFGEHGFAVALLEGR